MGIRVKYTLYDLVELSNKITRPTHIYHNKSIDHVLHKAEQDQMIQMTKQFDHFLVGTSKYSTQVLVSLMLWFLRIWFR